LPAFPLDGGRMLRAGIWKWKNNLIDATRKATKVSKGIAYVLLVMGVFGIILGLGIGSLWLVFIGWFIKDGAESSLKQTIVSEALADVTVRQIMTRELVNVSPEQTVQDVIDNYFYRYKHGGFPVVRNGQLLGIITTHDVREVEEHVMKRVEDVMTPKRDVITVKPDEPAMEALVKLSKHDVGRLLVLDNEEFIGILTRSDLLRAVRTRIELGEKSSPPEIVT
jgi:CBS domain-containing protein